MFPTDDLPHSWINLAGRSTNSVGGRLEQGIKDNGTIVKFSWPKADRVSEVTFTEKAKKIGETNPLVENHILEMFGHLGSPSLTCSMDLIQKFLGVDTHGKRVLRVIVFKRLEVAKFLDKEDMLIAFLDTFFCKFFFRVICTSHNTHSVAGHWALWERGIEQGDVSIGNLTRDPVIKRDALNDFDLTRLSAPNQKPSKTENIGILPFLALDLLNERSFKRVPRLYRHEAESFTWCLIYVCMCMRKDSEDRIIPHRRNPLSLWFADMDDCLASKLDLADAGLLKKFPYHQDIELLVSELHDYWTCRYYNQLERKIVQIVSKRATRICGRRKDLHLPPGLSVDPEDPAPVQKTESYKELPDREWFNQVFQVILNASDVIPDSKEEIFIEIINRVVN